MHTCTVADIAVPEEWVEVDADDVLELFADLSRIHHRRKPEPPKPAAMMPCRGGCGTMLAVDQHHRTPFFGKGHGGWCAKCKHERGK